MAKYVTPGDPGVRGKGKTSVGDREVGGVLVETHIFARHPGRRLLGGKKLKKCRRNKKLTPGCLGPRITFREIGSTVAPQPRSQEKPLKHVPHSRSSYEERKSKEKTIQKCEKCPMMKVSDNVVDHQE